jgi:hypothetical protein
MSCNRKSAATPSSSLPKHGPVQARGEATDGTRRLNMLEQTLVGFEPATTRQQVLHDETIHRINEITTLRRKRLHSIGGGLPSVMWAIVLIGAALAISVTYLLQIERVVQVGNWQDSWRCSLGSLCL